MATAQGTQGSVTLNTALIASGTYATIDKWTANLSADVIDVTGFADTNYHRVQALGMHSMTGTIEGFCDDSAVPNFAALTAADRSAGGALTLQSSTGETFTLTAFLSNVSVDVQKTDFVRFTASFQSTGDITRNT